MDNERRHQYILAFAPFLLGALVFVYNMDKSTDRIAGAVENLTTIVEKNADRSIRNSKNLASIDGRINVLDTRVGHLESEK